jgi:ABC-2 type transport system permease protein
VTSTAALWYLTRTTARNRVRAQLARLRQPRYVIALLLGGLYLYWALSVNTRGEESPFADLGTNPAAPLIVAAVLLLTAARWWLATPDRTALAFTPAEVHLLFPAPVSRHALVHAKLLRGQVAILLNVLVWVVLLRGGGGSVDAWQRGIALWILFSTFTLHRLAAALVRLNLAQRQGMARGRAAAPLLLFGALFTAVGTALWEARPALTVAWADGFTAVFTTLHTVLQQPLPRIALLPVQALVAPVFATSGSEWLGRLAPALLVLALHYLWVIRTDAAFEEAALEASQERAKALAKRSGTALSATRSRSGAVPRIFPLPSWGHPAITIAWKNAAAAIRGGGWLKQIGILFAIFAGSLVVLTRTIGMPIEAMLALTAVWGGMLLLLGPVWTRYDLRLDLRDLTMLRTMPLSGRAIVSAEIVGVSLLHTMTIYAFLLVPVLVAATDQVMRREVGALVGHPGSALLTALLLVPALNLLTFTVQNGLALLVPAWVQLGTDRRGFEAMGQTLLTTGLTVVGGAIALVFPALLGVATLFIARAWLGPWASPLAALIVLLCLLAEVVPLWMALGTVLDRTEPGDVPGQRS